jgi:peptidoglycan hydrolase CwlO-like protein
MGHKRTEALLNRLNATLSEQRDLVAQTQKRLTKAPNQKIALAIRRELELLQSQTEVLKARQKALKRGIVPSDLQEDHRTR